MLAVPAYPTYTIFLAFGMAVVVAILLMPPFIRFMKRDGIGQQVRADGPQTHLVKQGTPTMGGVVILVAILVTLVFFGLWSPDLILAVGATYATALLGLADDIESVSHGRSLGLTPAQKMAGLTLVSVVFCLLAVNWAGITPTVTFPGGFSVDLGVLAFSVGGVSVPWVYMVFVFLLFAGLSNAVNLTDGLDGLAAGTVLVVMVFMAMVCFRYNELSLAVFAACVAGACVGFLWYNCHPAQVFMGDTGSLALGAAFAALAVLTKTEVTSLIMGGLFIVEALSVMIQVVSFKKTGKRVFLMAPLHHHFEKKGWSETKVVIRFWIVSAAFAALGFALYFQLG
ncbi:phospho-N-acetylmuramoyl-pentapeptide-transferase [Coriobacteriaceae bacterium]|uniref:Phospho-N-acetylmuramoyl-pentapeptide-transferase n=1 Tax=Granulimonas faecalis TaxID=2894155 RepID=A0AAV5B330_9ACTN|nr:phospho-N-acetylmuramoyl-pentapeptide-transferase [Granulimonas faecalis]MBF0598492.1 phospho-N-acetylmuramoyl-pentapeptide-transferase [Atopobiaceae bacterium FL090493]TGY60593.1 phospho-N-acetylmuramoyl-pentapeptide-transferase [Coriobacteriaceae bacterium]GJM55502.1 phospho-N-acetylmuramoyl-pentapeptide-transferase [Granulimonas faecalis]